MAQSTLTEMKHAASPAKPSGKRRDIQGLRAIAVIAVVFDHLLHWPSGGFVGVDVFFVISGFVITASLLREHDKTGHISFSGFYRRRVRRILPAATVVLVLTAALGHLLFNASRADQAAADTIWAFFFSANWHFAAVGTDYFQASGPVSPVQHFWSLSVEEQFYFVWPWLMLLIFWLGGRSTKWDRARAHKAIGFAMLAIVVVSFAWSMVQSQTSPTVAYFSTFTRAWELGVGALLAVLAPSFKLIPTLLRPVLGWAGLAGIAWSIFAINAGMPFPGPWAAAPVLATAVVIAAGTGGEQRFMWPLTNRVSGYVGDISYSLYLWHFPVIIFLASLITEESPMFVPGAVVLMMVLAALSFHFVEQPVRKSIWLDNSPAAEAVRRKRKHRGRKPVKQSTQLIGLGILAVVTFSVVAYALLVPPAAPKSAPVPIAKPSAEAQTPETALSNRTAAIQTALSTPEWPALVPDVGELASKGRDNASCQFGPRDGLPSDADVEGKCLNGDPAAPKTAVLLGDSYAAALSPGVIDALAPAGYKVIVLTKNSCPAISIAVKLESGDAYPGCTEFQEFSAAQVARLAPDMVILSSWNGQIVDRLASGATGPVAIAEWKTAFQNTANSYSGSAAQVVAISPPPHGKNLQECATPLSKPGDCTSPVAESFRSFVSAEQSAIAAVAKPTVRYVSMLVPTVHRG
jgi:peptidoglycan/LPS O-acetylase OafA/YrhL